MGLVYFWILPLQSNHFNTNTKGAGLNVCIIRAQNNGRSTDNFRPDWEFDWSNVHLAGHADQHVGWSHSQLSFQHFRIKIK